MEEDEPDVAKPRSPVTSKPSQKPKQSPAKSPKRPVSDAEEVPPAKRKKRTLDNVESDEDEGEEDEKSTPKASRRPPSLAQKPKPDDVSAHPCGLPKQSCSLVLLREMIAKQVCQI